MAQHVRADAIGRDARIRRHSSYDLEQAHAAQVRLPPREQPECARRHVIEPALDRCLRARRDRDQPLLGSLAAQDEERLAGADRAPRQAHELARPKPRAVKQLQQREVADRQRLAACGAFLGLPEHPRDFGLVENPRQRALEPRPRKRRGGVVAAQAVVDEEAEEAPQRGRAPRHRRRREVRPICAQPRQIVRRSAGQRPDGIGRALEVIAIGAERVPRSTRLRRHHVEEPVDQRLVFCGHVRGFVWRFTSVTALLRRSSGR